MDGSGSQVKESLGEQLAILQKSGVNTLYYDIPAKKSKSSFGKETPATAEQKNNGEDSKYLNVPTSAVPSSENGKKSRFRFRERSNSWFRRAKPLEDSQVEDVEEIYKDAANDIDSSVHSTIHIHEQEDSQEQDINN